MRIPKVFKFLLVYNILETVCRIVRAADGRTHAFVHVDGELKYLMDGVQMDMQEFYRDDNPSAISFTDINEENLNTYASPIAFHPPMLNFNFHPVGMPHMERVIIQNLSPDTSIHMLSISGNTLHTHCSFFQEKIIPPGGNTSFDVVLLAREEGPVEDTLFIHTSLGSFKFQVSAIGVPNPYRLRPFVGVKMPLNSSFSPVIYMHNPHSSTLQLTELYSSGGDLHLELPEDEAEGPKSLWQIPPYETKPIIKANFVARVEKNHTAFIRFRTNCSGEDYLLLPVEVDVTSTPGIYSHTEVLDFGLLRTQDEPKQLTLTVLNSGHKHVHITNVITTPVNEAVDIKFTPLKVAPDTIFSTQVATITFYPERALFSKQCCGKIVVKSKNNQFKLQIPYQVQLIKGSLLFNKNCTRFYVGSHNSSQIREFNITNNYNVVLIIYRITVSDDAKKHFSVKMKKPVVLEPGKTSVVALINYKPSEQNLHLTSFFRLHTNVSHFDIPLLSFTGRLKLFLPHSTNESSIDFGTLGMGDKRTVIFALINLNPVDVNLKFWGSNSSKAYVELVGVDKGNASTLAWRQNFTSMPRSLILKPQHYAIFRIGITAPNREGLFQSSAFVETQYEKINIPFNLRTSKGVLKVDEIFFENSFPGKISTQSIYVHSTFSHSMTVTAISTVPEDSRFSFDLLKRGSPVLHPNSKNMVGKIHFDHRKYCKQKCYSGLPTTTTMGNQWLLGMALPADVSDTDKELFRTLCKRWKNLMETEGKTTNITLRIDTTEVKGYLLKAHTSLQWPRLLNKYKIKFPITQWGNRTVKDFTLENPSSLPILVQIVPLSLYPNPSSIVNILKEPYSEDLRSHTIAMDADIFSLEDLAEDNNQGDSHIPAYRKSLEEYFGIESHKKTIAMLLTPGMRVRIPIGFKPKDDNHISSLILIRNNLTVMDAILVHGQGGYGQIKFGNLSPSSSSFLMFELTERHLKECDSSKSPKYITPNFTVRRQFTARNTGALPVYIKGFDVNGKPCGGYGFHIFNCHGFELKPNATRKIDIAYTPDFSLSHVERTLNLHTNQGHPGQILQFRLAATIPRHLLAPCFASLPRPNWELYLYYTFLILSVLMVLFVGLIAFLDSGRILHKSFFPFMTSGIITEKLPKENVFDLKAICATTMENNNSLVKNNYQNDLRKKKETTPEHNRINGSISILSSIKSNGVIPSKRKDNLPTTKEMEDQLIDIKHSKKKNSKLRQPQDNYSMEPEFVEIRRSQARNSWMRFLSPRFTFQSCSNNSKPSVATQTFQDTLDANTLNDLDIIEDENLDTYVESNEILKIKNKNDNKYLEHKNCLKKNGDTSPEEETSSTTTETSQTESDISEKDQRLPDVCVISKSQKTKSNKLKSKDNGTNSPLRTTPPSPLKQAEEISIETEDFEFNAKNKNDKKPKDFSTKLTSDNLQTNTLELPYRPKPVINDSKSDSVQLASSSIKPLDTSESLISKAPQRPAHFSTSSQLYIKKSSPPPNNWASGGTEYSPSVLPEDNLTGSKLKNWMSSKTNDQPLSYSDAAQMMKEHNDFLAPGSQRRWNNNYETLSPPKESAWNNASQSISLMEALQTEQEIRCEAYKRQMRGVYNDWPGFDLTPVIESFWDSNYNPAVGSWTSNPGNDPDLAANSQGGPRNTPDDDDLLLNDASHFPRFQ